MGNDDVTRIMAAMSALPLTQEQLREGLDIINAANPAPWKVEKGEPTDWEVANFGALTVANKSCMVLVTTDGCNASRLCGDAEDDANAVAWLRNNARDLIGMALQAHKLAGRVGVDHDQK